MAVTKIDQLLPFKFQVIIADESHYLKSKQSKRTKSLVPMIKDAKRAILLSGTPALSRPLELYSQLNALDPGKWNDLKEFGKRYCRDARPSSKKGLFNSHNRFSWGENGYKGSNNTTELHFILSATVMIRRLKKDILLELPPKHRYLLKITVEDEVKRNRFLELLSKISKYEELIASRKRSKHSGDASSLLPSSSSALTITGEGSDENGDKKQVILQLFNESGEAKLPSVLKYIDNYLAKDNAGKVKQITNLSSV
jgi:SWI/SNF-related matrix-associated actin-dependent regulator 1 of chromatin subfamily A